MVTQRQKERVSERQSKRGCVEVSYNKSLSKKRNRNFKPTNQAVTFQELPIFCIKRIPGQRAEFCKQYLARYEEEAHLPTKII